MLQRGAGDGPGSRQGGLGQQEWGRRLSLIVVAPSLQNVTTVPQHERLHDKCPAMNQRPRVSTYYLPTCREGVKVKYAS